MSERGEQHLVQQLVPEALVETLDEDILIELPGVAECHSTPLSRNHLRIAMEVSSVPLPETQIRNCQGEVFSREIIYHPGRTYSRSWARSHSFW